jgi:membrane-bound lytic murein transglycosylase D
MTTPRDMPFDLHIPVGTRDVFTTRIKDIPEDKRASWRFHVVRSGETLDGIATASHVHAADIAKTNGLTAGDSVDTGDELVIPITVASAGPQRYGVRRGDTLITVADRFGVSVEELKRWNHLSSNVVRPGSSLAVAEPVRLAPAMRGRNRTAKGKYGSRAASSSVHAASAHVETKHSTVKLTKPSTATKKTLSPKQ